MNNVTLFKDNMLLSLCLASVEHGGECRMKPALKKCKCHRVRITTFDIIRIVIIVITIITTIFDRFFVVNNNGSQ